jgi:RNA polymerase sigma-70 factor, ECF subfamily
MGDENDRALALLERISAGDEAAMAEFYRLFARQVYAFALRHLGRPAEAEDVVVDCMYEVWNSAGRFGGRSLVRTWLFSIARFRLLDRIRKRGPENAVDIDDMKETLASDDEGGFGALAERQRSEHVAHCMDKLSPEHRECVHLVFYMELPLAEVAEIQNCPENTVKTRLFHAKRNLKRCLESRLRDDDGIA